MADELPEPKSRKESYLAKAAGMDVTTPEKPESRIEQYLDAIAEGGGGGGGGGTSDFNELDNRPKYNGTAMTGETDIPAVPTVVQTTGTSTTDIMSQNAVTSMAFADPSDTRRVQLGAASEASGNDGIAIGRNSKANQSDCIAVGSSAKATGIYCSTVGTHATSNKNYAVAVGAYATTTRNGEINVGTGTNNYGYSGSSYRILGGVYDGQEAHDAATVGQVNATIDAINTALSTNIPHIGAA